MTWRVVHASEAGTSHSHNLTLCQDRCLAKVYILANGQPMLSMFLADGAGSAVKGEVGADLTIETAGAFVANKVKQGEFCLSNTLARDLVLAVRDRIYFAAEAERLNARDYACTFIGVLSSQIGTLVMQIGDGGVVVDTGSGLELAIIPMTGEYANMTLFVTDEDAARILKTKTYPNHALKVAAFTDGIQSLALNLATNTAHEPFFEPFFNGMSKATAEQEDQLQGRLVKFLGSQAVNERTDDDKTLALACWMP